MEPPANALISAYVGYKVPEDTSEAVTTQAEDGFLNTLGPNKVKSFDNLPLNVQEFFKKKSAIQNPPPTRVKGDRELH
jgi:hypothetical protein